MPEASGTEALPPAAENNTPAAHGQQPFASQVETLLEKTLTCPDGTQLPMRIELVHPIGAKRCRFMEDTEDRFADRREIIGCDRHRGIIYISRDQGDHWIAINPGQRLGRSIRQVLIPGLSIKQRLRVLVQGGLSNALGGRIRNLRTLSDGRRVLQASDPCETFIFDPQWKLIAQQRAGRYTWHGTRSVDESATGTVMFAEYRGTTADESKPEPLSVWRLKRGETRWEAVHTCTALNRPDEGGDIRHFHTCMADPDRPGRWYVSTGDLKQHNRLWTSDDDGDTWSEITVQLDPIDAAAPGMAMRALRFTSAIFDDDSIYWATDDHLGTESAALIRAKRYEPNLPMTVLCRFKLNLMRSMIEVRPGVYVCISESKNDVSSADLFVVDKQGQIGDHVTLENLTQKRCPVTASLNTLRAHDGVAFAPNLSRVLTTSRQGMWRFRFG